MLRSGNILLVTAAHWNFSPDPSGPSDSYSDKRKRLGFLLGRGRLLIPFSMVDEYPLALGASILVAPVFFFSMVEMVSHLIFKAGDMEYPVWLELLDNPFSVAYWLLLVPAVIMGTHWLVNVLVKPKHYTDALQLYGATLKGVEPVKLPQLTCERSYDK
jgi:hypothetical protein